MSSPTKLAAEAIERMRHQLAEAQRIAHLFTRRRDGTGLGLSIAQRIVERHRGRMHAAHRSEGGAALTFELPCVSGPDPGQPSLALPAAVVR